MKIRSQRVIGHLTDRKLTIESFNSKKFQLHHYTLKNFHLDHWSLHSVKKFDGKLTKHRDLV